MNKAHVLANLNHWQQSIKRANEDPTWMHTQHFERAMGEIIRALELGLLRVASPAGLGPVCGQVPMDGDLLDWEVHTWVKEAISLLFRWRVPQETGGPGEGRSQERVHGPQLVWCDKLDMRTDLGAQGVRTVPVSAVREGAHVASGAIVMPGFVNTGAFVGSKTMVDTWATVGSCAQVGQNVHIAGGVGIGGVLEPAGARPVLIGDGVFLGSRVIVVEGAVVGGGAVLGANVCVTATTPVYDVTQNPPKEYRGQVPPRAIVVPGTRPKTFPGGTVQLQCAYIIGYRSANTENRVALNPLLREGEPPAAGST